MEHHPASTRASHISAEACEWFMECRSGDLDHEARREFDRWLRKSPEHLSAYLEIAAIWNEGPALDPHHQWDADRLIAEGAADHDNVVSISGLAQSYVSTPAAVDSASPSARTDGFAARTRRVYSIAASIAVVGFAVGALVWFQLSRAPTYVTEIGEQRSIVLADGSTVELNSRSKLKVRYSERERAIELLQGQALFRVARDHARPFIVASDSTRVRAVGTQFDVYKKRGGTIVTVVEGHVAILASTADPSVEAIAVDSYPPPSIPAAASAAQPQDGAGAGIYLSAGEQVTVTRATVQKAVHPNLVSAMAWRQRQLIFDSASLTEVAEEFNRYNARQLVILNPELYDFHISGVFSSTDPASLIRFLRERPGVQVIETESEIQIKKTP